MIWHGGKRPSYEKFEETLADSMIGWLGIEFVEAGDDFLRMRMPVDHRTVQPMKRLHGGASVALAESIGSMAAGRCVDLERFTVVGAEINANHLRPAFSGWVYATARPVSLGSRLHVWSIEIADEEGRLVCISRFTAAVIPLPQQHERRGDA
jgi:1,4-dihydroxy-2-naphthoyl-CoA hydrolase